MILKELEPRLLELCKSPYGHFVVSKLIALAPKDQLPGGGGRGEGGKGGWSSVGAAAAAARAGCLLHPLASASSRHQAPAQAAAAQPAAPAAHLTSNLQAGTAQREPLGSGLS